MRKLKTAVIGAGTLGEVHARAYLESGRAEVLWICDTDLERARALAERFGCRATAELGEVAGDDRVDAASVATPDFAHFEPVRALLESGKHCLCEKPLATDVDEAREMVETARERGAHLMVDFQNRWSPPFVRAKAEVDSGDFGELVCGFARLSNTLAVPERMLAWAARSGPEWFLMPHTVDIVRWLAGSPAAESVHAAGRRGLLSSRGIDVYDALQATVRFEGGGFCTFESSWVMPESWPSGIDFKVSLQGTVGKIEIDGDDQGISVTSDRHRRPFVLGDQTAFGRTVGFFQQPIFHFVDALLEGRRPECPGADGLAVTEIIAAARRSAETGETARPGA